MPALTGDHSRASTKSAPSRPPRHDEPYNASKRNSVKSTGSTKSKEDKTVDAQMALIEDQEIIDDLLDLGFTKREIGKMDLNRRAVLHPKGSDGSWGRPDPAAVRKSARALIQWFDRDVQWEEGEHMDMQRMTFTLFETVARHGLRLRALRDVDLMRVLDTNKIHMETTSGVKILDDSRIVMKRKSRKEEEERENILVSIDAFVSMVPSLLERDALKQMFQDQDKEAPPSEEIMTRVFREFASKKLHRPGDKGTADPERPACLSEPTVVEIFEFFEVYMTTKDVTYLFQQIDKDRSGTIEENEWKEFFKKASHRERLKKRACLQDAYLRTLFEEFDVAARGFLTMDDLMNIIRFINLRMSENVAEKLFFQIDDNHNNRIELDEFMGFFQAVQSQDDMKQKIQQMSTKKERSQWCQLAIGLAALIAFIVCIIVELVPLAIVTGSMVGIFVLNFIGWKNVERFGGCLQRNTCVFTVKRLRYVTVSWGILFLVFVIWHQFDQAEIDGDHTRQGEKAVIPKGFITFGWVFLVILLALNVLIYIESNFKMASRVQKFVAESPRARQAAAIRGKLISLGTYPIGAASPKQSSSPRRSPRRHRKNSFSRDRANAYAAAAIPPDYGDSSFGANSFGASRTSGFGGGGSKLSQVRVDYEPDTTTTRWQNSPTKGTRPIVSREGGDRNKGIDRASSAKIEPFRPLSEQGARGQIAGMKKGDQVTGMGILKKGLDE
ncbi:unnamed protein product [Amoebophrya sp. A120]|nr:unnamed protein product [Amoebophrya sp. A120]|eukprot:GSA120T00000852001.1